jgi:two-component sensor histidine kinase
LNVQQPEADEKVAGLDAAALLAGLDPAAVRSILALAAEAANTDRATLCLGCQGVRLCAQPPRSAFAADLQPVRCAAVSTLMQACTQHTARGLACAHQVRANVVDTDLEARLCLPAAPADERGRWTLEALTVQAATLINLHVRLAHETTLAAETDHRIKNALQSIASFLRLHEARAQDDTARRVLAAAARQVRAVALLHDEIAATGAAGDIRFDTYMKRLGTTLEQLIPDSVRVDIDVPAVTLAPDAAAMIAVITNEFVTNAAKHAFGPGERGTVTIRGQAGAQGLAELTLSDDGAGLPETVPSGGLGLRIAEAAARKLGGRLSTGSEPGSGCRFTLCFPRIDER